MSSSRYVSRHGGTRRRPLRRLPSSLGAGGARAAAKSVAGLGIVLGCGAFVIAPSSAVDVQASASFTSVGDAQVRAADLLADRAAGPGASRSAARTTLAVTAPSGTKAKDVHEGVGALALDPVVKPKPKPKPAPVENEPTQSTSGTDSTNEADSTNQADSAPVQESAPPAPTKAPKEEPQSGEQSSPSPKPTGSSVDTGSYASQAAAIGLGPNAQKVYSAVRTQFPDMTNIGGYRAGDPGDHGSGRAADIMVSGARGDQVAAWLQANTGQLNIAYIIWQQRIWMPGGSWKPMSDRGSPTQNHFDHVHVSVN